MTKEPIKWRWKGCWDNLIRILPVKKSNTFGMVNKYFGSVISDVDIYVLKENNTIVKNSLNFDDVAEFYIEISDRERPFIIIGYTNKGLIKTQTKDIEEELIKKFGKQES